MRLSWCTEANVCICLDNAEMKSSCTLFNDERRFYTFQFHAVLVSYAHNNNTEYVIICNSPIKIIMPNVGSHFRY